MLGETIADVRLALYTYYTLQLFMYVHKRGQIAEPCADSRGSYILELM
jgi:hypothetical protein